LTPLKVWLTGTFCKYGLFFLNILCNKFKNKKRCQNKITSPNQTGNFWNG
jgi:hypothetical protein